MERAGLSQGRGGSTSGQFENTGPSVGASARLEPER